jgi:tetratricopeptide (TPR) repeat protein
MALHARAEKYYKVRLSSGRVLGPLDRERVRLLILKNHIVGTESAREYPDGDWVDIHQIPNLADLLVARIEGRLTSDPSVVETQGYQPLPGTAGPTEVLPQPDFPPPPQVTQQIIPEEPPPAPDSLPASHPPAKTKVLVADPPSRVFRIIDQEARPPAEEDPEDRTVVGELPDSAAAAPEAPREQTRGGQSEDDDRTWVRPAQEAAPAAPNLPAEQPPEESLEIKLESTAMHRNIAQERTIMFEKPIEGTGLGIDGKGKKKSKEQPLWYRVIIAVGVAYAAYDLLYESDPVPKTIKVPPIRATLPAPSQGKADPKASKTFYEEGLAQLAEDHVLGYRKAVGRFQNAITADPSNTKAYAMLASAYLNLIDSSNKDEKYFQVISNLIEVARAQAKDIIETVVADIDFYITVGKPEAAYQRMLEYTKDRTEYGPAHFLYMATTLYHRGDYPAAMRMISNVPDNKVPTAKIFFLRARIAEKLNDYDTALRELEKAIKVNKNHAKSHLRTAEILTRQGKIKEAVRHIEFLVQNGELLDPSDLARAYYLHSQLFQVFEKWHEALGAIDKAVVLDSDNADYILERYTLLTKVGDSIERVQGQARMYFFLSEGQKAAKSGNTKDAITFFLQARQNNPSSPLPLVRLGDMFSHAGDVVNARSYYEKATQLAPKSTEIWAKYATALIHSYEFDEAQKVMQKFGDLKMGQSARDKLMGDLYAKQSRPVDAMAYYQKAMSRDTIDPGVYIAFANTLLDTKNFKEAPFFYALARRFDPLNVEALLGTARATAQTEGPDRAIAMLQDELAKGNASRAELLAGIAEFQIQRGEWEAAQSFVEQAMNINPNYAYPWKLQAQIFANQEHVKKNALDKAAEAYKSFSDRNPSDPTGYMERYKIFVKKAEFEKADLELIRVHQVFPKFPNLHYYRGALYSLMGNHKLAIHEFEQERKNNPRGVGTLIALGKEFLEEERNDEALRVFNEAMQIAPQMPDPKHWAGFANYKLKNFEGAVLLYRAAIAGDPGNPILYKKMGMAYRAMGNALEAKRAFQKYLEMEPDAPDKAEFERFL